MAYTCVLEPSHECNGCQECEETKTQYDRRWDCEYDNDDEYCDYLEKESDRYDS